jgi:hypothetical protein
MLSTHVSIILTWVSAPVEDRSNQSSFFTHIHKGPVPKYSLMSTKRFISQDHIGGFSMKRECTNTHTHKHIISYMKFNLKLLQIKCHVLKFIKDASKDNQSFCRSVHLSRQTHILCPRREWAYSDDLHLWVLVGNSALIDLDLPLTALVSVAGRRKILICTQINKNNKSKSLSDYAQQDLSVTTRRPQNLGMQGFKWINELKPTSTYY